MDNLLKKISKTQGLKALINLVDSKNLEDVSRTEFLLTLILRALTDKGFKSHAAMLSQEYYNQEDLDGDFKIYGLDWVYENPPKILQQIPSEGIEDIRKFKPLRT